jgi:hypothetical protein
MEVPRDQAFDLPLGQAWFGFARFSPLYRPRAHGGAQFEEAFADPRTGALPCAEALKRTSTPRRTVSTARPGSRNDCASTRRTRRQVDVLAATGSMVLMADEDYHLHEPSKAVFTHASASPTSRSSRRSTSRAQMVGNWLVMQAISSRSKFAPREQAPLV